jgi:alkanesulfonate monooxygenase SsuD/methylene tetrahydromethanopterin reductase-like flavin-dependent oxidoreductase (luciferase family)
VGRIGDGWLVSRVTPDEVRQGREIVFATAAKYQRTIEEDHIGVLLGYYISPNGQQATAKAEPFVTQQRPDAPFTAFSAVGSTEQIAEMIQQYIAAGASKFVVRPLCAGAESMEQLEMMGQDILPLFHTQPVHVT